MSLNANYLVIDCLQSSKPERDRFEEWRRGDVNCVHMTVATMENARETLSLLGKWNRHFEENADLIAPALTAADIGPIVASKRTAVILGFQDTSPFEDDIELVEIFHRLGVRVVQLTYNIQNRVGSGCWETEDSGISKHFGKNVLSEMNRLGMLIDVSHCGERTSMDAIDLSSQPIAVTHANPDEFVGKDIELNRRNKSTALLKRLAERGGVVGLSLYPKIMKGGSDCTLDTFLDMVSWTVDRIGIDSVAMGTDFYAGWPLSAILWWRAGRFARESAVPITGFSAWPSFFQSPADFPKLVHGLESRGFKKDEVNKFIGGNWLRLFGEVFAAPPPYSGISVPAKATTMEPVP